MFKCCCVAFWCFVNEAKGLLLLISLSSFYSFMHLGWSWWILQFFCSKLAATALPHWMRWDNAALNHVNHIVESFDQALMTLWTVMESWIFLIFWLLPMFVSSMDTYNTIFKTLFLSKFVGGCFALFSATKNVYFLSVFTVGCCISILSSGPFWSCSGVVLL